MRIIIIEDEGLTRQWIKHKIEEIDSSYEVTEVFSNALDALHYLENHEVDLIFSDIRLPIMNGLEFFKKVNEMGISAQKIILSAFDEFHYAREAIKIGVLEFLLKTEITKEKLAAVLKSVEVNCGDGHSKTPNMKEVLLTLTAERDLSESETKALLSPYGLGIKNLSFLSLVFPESTDQAAVSDFISSYLSQNHIRSVHAFCESGTYFILFGASDQDVFRTLPAALASYTGKKLYAGGSELKYFKPSKKFLGNPVCELCTKAKLSLENRIFFDKTDPILYREMRIWEDKDSLAFSFGKETRYILNLLECKQYQKAEEELKRLTADIREADYLLVGYLKSIYNEILQAYLFHYTTLTGDRDVMEYQTRISTILSERTTRMRFLEEGVSDFISSLAKKASSFRKSSRYSELTLNIIRYVENNYRNKITLQDISRALFFSETYISGQFKKEVGIPLTKYLQEYRLKKALPPLLENKRSISEIAMETGFFDVAHFSKLFKETYGESPLEYRRRHTEF